jgi:predicted dehydrogenase
MPFFRVIVQLIVKPIWTTLFQLQPKISKIMILDPQSEATDRRNFIKTTTTAVAASSLIFPTVAQAQGNGSLLKIGLIGCGGRGTGAAGQALSADDNVQLHAVADVFETQARNSIKILSNQAEDKVKVDEDKIFIGMDAYLKVLESDVDVVILTTPPGFRPMMLKAAIDAGKHVFCEKPVAVDATGVRSVMQSAQDAASKKLTLVTGFCWRYSFPRRALFEKIHAGAIGDITSMLATYHTGPVKPMPPASTRPAGLADVAWQVQNWYNFSWLGGDSLVEQAIHSVDKIAWAMKDIDPIAAVATGGRQIPAEDGNIFDHFHVAYEYPGNVFCHLASRQIPHCHGENNDFISGTKGSGIIAGGRVMIRGEENWRYDGEDNDMYQQEHDEMYASIRSGAAKNDGAWMAKSTMLGIMGRMAAYTGQKVTWEQALQSKEDLAPDNLKWDDAFKPTPMPMPGVTKLV